MFFIFSLISLLLLQPAVALGSSHSTVNSTVNCSSVCPPQDTASKLLYPRCSSNTADGTFWFLNHLGQGSASSVVKAAWVPPHRRSQRCSPGLSTDASEAPRTLAIKIFDRTSQDGPEDAYFESIRTEYAVMEAFPHPNVVQGVALLEENGRFLMAMEFCDHALINLLEKGGISEIEVDYIWGRILAVVRLMHSRGVAHRDLKAENIFICDNGQPKLGDFGSAVPFLSLTGERLAPKDVQGTEVYLPPEASEDYSGPYEADVADIWQLGMLYVMMSTRMFPWETASPDDEGFRAYLNNPYDLLVELPLRSRKMIGRMLEIDPRERATWGEIWEDQWVKACTNVSFV